MSYARWSNESSVYVFGCVDGGVECCGCHLADDNVHLFDFGSLVAHFREHEAAGHTVPTHLFDEDTYEADDFRASCDRCGAPAAFVVRRDEFDCAAFGCIEHIGVVKRSFPESTRLDRLVPA